MKLPPLPPLKRGASVRVAYSGGLDSTVLLHALATAGVARLSALHVHHGLQAVADSWAERCAAQCEKLGVPFQLLRVKIEASDPAGPEAAARNARYAALAASMKSGDLLVTAHHQDDQAETVLLRLLRGTGIDGLAAMEPLRAFAPGQLWRPLLDVPRTAILAYAREQGLEWIEDPHNRDPRYARSWLRKEIVPRLQEQYPQASASLARAAKHAGQGAALLDELAQLDLDATRNEHGLGVAKLLALSAARRANLLRHWLAGQGFAPPASAVIERLEREVLRARADASPLLHGGQYEFRRYRDSLVVMAPLPPAPKAAIAWDGAGALELPSGCGRLLSSARRPLNLSIRFPRGGEKLKPQGDRHTRTLKHLFQEAGVPPWERERTPLIYRGDELLCVGDRWPGAAWAAEQKRGRFRIRWERAAA